MINDEARRKRRYFAVCCTVRVSEEIINNFLHRAYHEEGGGEPMLMVIDNLDMKYEVPTEPPCNVSSFSFEGKSNAECRSLLRRHVEEHDSDIEPDQFVIVDERTTQDFTVLVLDGDVHGDEEPHTIRVYLQYATLFVTSADVGNTTVEESNEDVCERGNGIWPRPLQ